MIIIKDLGIKETRAGYKKKYVIAKCGYCGSEKEYIENSIKTKNTKSCGCQKYKLKSDAITRHQEYNLFKTIKTRCYNKNRKYYHLYGGRGIKICDEWLKNPMSFVDWAKNNGYKKGMFIDRINPNGNYEPSNCRFVNAIINARNTRLLSKSNTSGYRGVTRKKGNDGVVNWRARISINGKNVSLGVYKNKLDAAKAYNKYIIDNKTEHPLNKVSQ